MKKETKEIVALTEKWLEKISDITVDYQKAIQALAKAQEEYKKLKAVFTWLVPLVSIGLFLFFLYLILLHTCPNPISVKFQELEITQHCK